MIHINGFYEFLNEEKDGDTIVYHGSTKELWNDGSIFLDVDGVSTLYLTDFYDVAVRFAYRSADAEAHRTYNQMVENGMDIYDENGEYLQLEEMPQCIVCSIRLSELLKLSNIEFYPDWGAVPQKDDTWRDTLKKTNTFCIEGDIQAIKHLFTIEDVDY
jgi:hypothetical protein